MNESISGQAASGSNGSDRAKLSIPQEGLITTWVDGSLELRGVRAGFGFLEDVVRDRAARHPPRPIGGDPRFRWVALKSADFRTADSPSRHDPPLQGRRGSLETVVP